MKKITALIFVAFCAVFAAGCTPEAPDKGDKLSVVTTIFAPYDFVRQIAGDKADCAMLLKPGTDAHSYEPTPRDIISLQNCDLFIYVGGENDAWVEDILSSMDTSSMETIKLMDCVEERYEEEFVEGMDGWNGHDEDDDHAEWDEHVWTSPVNAALICGEITETLERLDAANAAFYKNNMQKYGEELADLDADFRSAVSDAQGDTLVFGDRFPLRYFVEEYGLKYYAAFPGCASESEASAATVAFTPLSDSLPLSSMPSASFVITDCTVPSDRASRTEFEPISIAARRGAFDLSFINLS